ncbi:MAG TPA: hypothetical protein VLW85_06475, partial [Myxococcales bacterium]|nr:hypothetical protein [Myxococcales bacterium]
CAVPPEFGPALSALQPGDEALVVAWPQRWAVIATLAAERRLEPISLDRLPDADPTLPSLALVWQPQWRPARGWQEIARAREWALLRKVVK